MLYINQFFNSKKPLYNKKKGEIALKALSNLLLTTQRSLFRIEQSYEYLFLLGIILNGFIFLYPKPSYLSGAILLTIHINIFIATLSIMAGDLLDLVIDAKTRKLSLNNSILLFLVSYVACFYPSYVISLMLINILNFLSSSFSI